MKEVSNNSAKLKICFAASTGGHFEQLMLLKPLMDKYDSIVVAERTNYNATNKDEKVYYLRQVNRKEKLFLGKLILNSFSSLRILCKEKPDVVICTGVLAMIPICLLARIMGKKLVFIESFAMVTAPTKSGKLLYRYANRFYVQWEKMKEIFPNSIYIGGIY